MFFIFGWGQRTVKDYGPTLQMTCPNCNNDTWLNLYKIRDWFTFFFIPIFPHQIMNVLLCRICSTGLELSRDQLEQARELNSLTSDYIDRKIDESSYINLAQDIDLFGTASDSKPQNLPPGLDTNSSGTPALRSGKADEHDKTQFSWIYLAILGGLILLFFLINLTRD